MGSVGKILTGGLFGSSKKNTDDSRAPAVEEKKDTAIDTTALDAAGKKARAASRRARVQGQTQLSDGSTTGLRTSLDSSSRRAVGIK